MGAGTPPNPNVHVLIVGVSGSGKSWAAKRLAADIPQGSPGENRMIVFDPIESSGWPEWAEKYSGPETFLTVVEKARSTYVFIDEYRILWAFDAVRTERAIYTGRNRGLLFIVIAQRVKMVPPNARSQCARVISFKQQIEDARILAADYNDILEQTAQLDRLECIVTDGFDVSYYKLDFSSIPPVLTPRKNHARLSNTGSEEENSPHRPPDASDDPQRSGTIED